MARDNMMKDDKIINQNPDFIVYQRNGTNYFISPTLKAGGGRIEGLLIKKAKNKLANMANKNLYLMRRVLLDFSIRKICFQDVHEDGSEIEGSTTKFIDFIEIERVEKTNLDIWMHDVSSQFPNKFNVFTEQRTYELFSKTRTERELWIEHFCKVIDQNAGKPVDFNKPSETYQKL